MSNKIISYLKLFSANINPSAVGRAISNIIIEVVFVATFLTIFFFTYVTTVENDIIKDQVNYIVESMLEDTKNFIPPEYLITLKNNLNTMKKPDLTEADNEVRASNNKIKKFCYKGIGIGIVVLMGLTGLASYTLNFSYSHILFENFILLIFIALTEFVFLNVFARNFISADTNKIKLEIINKMFP